MVKRSLVIVVLFLLLPGTIYAGIHFGHTNAVEEEVENLDEKVRNNTGRGSGSGSCSVNYGSWLSTINNENDLEREIIQHDIGDSPALDVIGNHDFGENDTGANAPELTTDTFLRRCNTKFDDTGDTPYEHHLFCRGYRLPDGKKYNSLNEIDRDIATADMDHYVVSFFHGGNIDDGGEDWQVPFIKQYQDGCYSRQTFVIWMGAFVEKNGNRRITDGNKWHLTSTKWGPPDTTVLYDIMSESVLNFTGHSTASCPFNNSDTRGLYPGGTAENEGRSIVNDFGNKALWVGENSSNSGACFSGTATDNPVNAQDNGVQLEVHVSPPPDKEVQDDNVAESVLNQY
ncbi:MAG: hypothetical protein ABEJ65_02315 [bacterium]